MERDSTFKDHHFWELQRKETLNAGLSLQIGATTLLIGGLYAMSKTITGACSVSNHLLIAGALLTGAALIGTLICLALAIFGYEYHHATDMRTLLGDRQHYEKQYQGIAEPDETPEVTAEKALSAFYVRMDKLYADAAGHNSTENQRKNKWIYWANRCLAASLICFALTGLPYLGATIGTDEKPVKVELLDPKGDLMSEEKKDAPPTPPPATQQKQIEHPPERQPVVCFDHAIPTGDKLEG